MNKQDQLSNEQLELNFVLIKSCLTDLTTCVKELTSKFTLEIGWHSQDLRKIINKVGDIEHKTKLIQEYNQSANKGQYDV